MHVGLHHRRQRERHVLTLERTRAREHLEKDDAKGPDALRDSEERYALAIEGANDGLWDWDLRVDEVYYSPRWMHMLGLAQTEVPGSPDAWFSRVHAEDVEGLRRDIERHLAGETDHFSHEHRIRCQDGSYRWMLSRGVAQRGRRGATRMAGSLTDIHARKVVEERLRRGALSDALTGLPNWALFKDRLRAAIAKAKRQPAYRFAVLFFDLDRFKTINDSLGHSNGDMLLVEIAKRVVDVLRPGDTFARLGGDEFAVLVEGCGEPSHANHVAGRVHSAFKEPLHLGGRARCRRHARGRRRSGAVQGFEALVRWEHPERGLLMPDAFIPMAEESGLIVPIGRLVFEEACRQVVAWQNASSLTPFVSVNFSGRQIKQSDVVPRVERVLRGTGCKASNLRLELTETMIMQSGESGVDRLVSLSKLDLQLYIDDFGTGYSSLSYLQRLPTHAIKIDRSFVREVAGKPEVVGSIIALARSLKMRVEAEGIETVDQVARLRELGCEFGQGYYFSKALTATSASGLIDTQLIR